MCGALLRAVHLGVVLLLDRVVDAVPGADWGPLDDPARPGLLPVRGLVLGEAPAGAALLARPPRQVVDGLVRAAQDALARPARPDPTVRALKSGVLPAEEARMAPLALAVPVEELAAARLDGLRVLVVGINYAPEHTGIAPYTTQACEHLARSGAEVLVLAGVPHYPHWSVPDAYRRHLRVDEVRREGVTVRRLRHMVPSRQSAARRAAYELSFGAHVLAQRLPWQPDVVLAVVPSLLGAAAAGRLARRHGARSVVWVQDLMGSAAAQSGIAGGGRVAALTGRLEAAVLRRADTVLVLNEAFARSARASGVPADRVVLRPNWTHVAPPRGDRARTRHKLGWGEDEVVALHSGNMGLKQGLDNVVAAARVAAAAAPNVRFVLMGDGNQREHLQSLAADVPNVQLLGPADDAEFPDYLAAADVLLVNERASAVDMSLPSKLTSYFRAGMPVVAAVPLDGGTAAEVHRSQAGVVVRPEDPAALTAAVLDLSTDRVLRTRMRRAASAYAHEQLASAPALAELTRAVVGPDALPAR